MEERFIEWTQKDIEYRTEMNKSVYQRTKDKIKAYELDTDKENRSKTIECKHCYYLRNMCGFSAMTLSYCGICKEPILNGSSDTNRVCDKCAGINDLCIRCGGEMD